MQFFRLGKFLHSICDWYVVNCRFYGGVWFFYGIDGMILV